MENKTVTSCRVCGRSFYPEIPWVDVCPACEEAWNNEADDLETDEMKTDETTKGKSTK